ncbi:MAG: NADH-quinone oxidoreductase subunit K [Croceibacterium sp.]
MTAPWYAVVGAGIFSLALYHLITAPDLLRRIIAANLLGAGIFLILVAVGYRGLDANPDPVPHALVLTGIVVAVSATGLALALARRLHDATDRSGDV